MGSAKLTKWPIGHSASRILMHGAYADQRFVLHLKTNLQIAGIPRIYTYHNPAAECAGSGLRRLLFAD